MFIKLPSNSDFKTFSISFLSFNSFDKLSIDWIIFFNSFIFDKTDSALFESLQKLLSKVIFDKESNSSFFLSMSK
jgi:hypothetical protein